MTDRGVRWWRSLRLPIAAAVALSAITVALVFALVADRNTMSDGISRLRVQAEDQLNSATVIYAFTGTVMSDAVLANRTDSVAPKDLLRSAAGDAVVTYFDGRQMWAASAVSDSKVMVVEVSAASLLQERHDLHRSLVLAGILTLVLATFGGWTVAGTLTGRLRRAARWVEVGATPDPVAADLGRDGDEVGELVARIDRLSGTLRDRVRTEQAFTADVAHELRTPLTALVSAVELLNDDDRATPLVRQQVTRVRTLVDELLELARADQDERPLAVESVDVGALLAEIIVHLPDLTPDAVFIEGSARVLAEPQRLERILVNLLANARRHGSDPVVVTVDGRRVTITDAGPGFPAELIATGPQRLRALGRSAGSGLGLVLAQTYARQIGATISYANTSNGAEVVLELQEDDGSNVRSDGSRVRSDGSITSVCD